MAATDTDRLAAQSPITLSRIGVGVDGFPEGRDAAVLGAALAQATGAELMLIAVHPEPLFVLPAGFDWRSQEREAASALGEIRDHLAPGARTMVETDMWVARALQRVMRREHRELLVMGSSRHAPDGRVRIGKRTRQLLCNFECALAVAPRGLEQRGVAIRRIGVGYDGGPEADAALSLAGTIAAAAGAELQVVSVVDDRMPASGFPYVWVGDMLSEWNSILESQAQELRDRATGAALPSGAPLTVESVRGRPADRLLELSSEVDLVVVGSRRWGPVARVMLGSTGEALMHDSTCPVLVVPRPHD